MKPSPQQTKPTYRLILEAQPNEVDAVVRLRRLLKLAGRAFGLKCLRVEPVKDAPVKDGV